jgi:hypothetical protein
MTKENKTSSISQDYDKSISSFDVLQAIDQTKFLGAHV